MLKALISSRRKPLALAGGVFCGFTVDYYYYREKSFKTAWWKSTDKAIVIETSPTTFAVKKEVSEEMEVDTELTWEHYLRLFRRAFNRSFTNTVKLVIGLFSEFSDLYGLYWKYIAFLLLYLCL
jgi:hypothetical protein